MRKKYLFYALLASSVLAAGCSKSNTQTATESTSSQEAVQSETSEGRISSISDSEITIETRQMGNPPEQGGAGAPGAPGNSENGAPDDANGTDSSSGNSNSQNTPPEKPDGDNGSQPGAQNGNKPDGTNAPASITPLSITSSTTVIKADGSEGSLSDLQEGAFVSVTYNDSDEALTITISDQKGSPDGMGGGPGGGPGGASAPTSYDAVTDMTKDTTENGKTYSSTGTDENAIHVSNGASVNLSDFTVTRNSSESTGGDQSSFYGIGAGILVTDGTAELKNGTITTDAKGGAGVFSYGDGVVNISDTTITTSQDTSGGIHVAGGGTLNAKNLTIETAGESSAAIRSDRGGGTMTVDGGSYTSKGTGSPAVYCTADIDIQNARLTAEGSEAVCIEGLNSLKLTDCDLAGDMPENEQNDCLWTVILYQSMSGDSEIGNSTFDMEGGTLTSHAGGLFYTTNTESSFYLKDVAITPSASNDFFLKCTGNANKRGWGQSGANGADCEFSADTQVMEGDVIWDSISNLDFTMKNGSTLTGAFVQDESCAGNGGSGYANLTIGSGCTWTVTGDSRITSLNNSGTIIGADGKSVSIVGADGTSYVKGDSAYTITVDTYTAA
ncbi:hypothetical protein [Clostridium sp.]|uniref:hypothetical protein n=1 Tax=uncultured Clostridium sp. TaxID=59620 RepID=UPI002600665F|nr:hypothetical protein [uncultured Clostridium sp.]